MVLNNDTHIHFSQPIQCESFIYIKEVGRLHRKRLNKLDKADTVD